jgi:hypothetical protein
VPEPVRAAVDSGTPTISVRERSHLRRSLANGLRAARGARDDAEAGDRWSRQLLGAEQWAPDYERQLDFSSRGAALTASVPAGRLELLLEALFEQPDVAMTLRRLPDGSIREDSESAGGVTGSALQRWLGELASIRAELAEVVRDDPEAQLLVPIVIEPASR